jgi:thymidylate kinase
MLTSVHRLIEQLNSKGVRYCHWKSNLALPQALAGETDIDLLIHRQDADCFRVILGQLAFRPAITTDGEAFPAVEHYYALDEMSGILVHVHAYFRVITGESLAKNYRLPIEEMLLQNLRFVDGVPLPTKSAELVIFTVRMMLKHTSIMELLLLARYWGHVQQEIEWLLDGGAVAETMSLVKCWLPTLDPDLVAECIAALRRPAPLPRRVILGHQLRAQLGFYARHSALRAWLGEAQKFSILLFRRLTRPQKGMKPRNGGAVIAFVGSEATGKSTLLAEMNGWLGEHFAVDQIHVGKPKATLVSALPNVVLPVLRARFPTQRSTHVEAQQADHADAEGAQTSYPLPFAIRSVLLAHDRRALLAAAYRRAANGTIVLCDRYPSALAGAPDSPQLAHCPSAAQSFALRRLLTTLEARLYRAIAPPDLVIYLSAPLEVTLARNASRDKKEPEEYVRRRHARSANLVFGRTPVCRIDTAQPFEQTVLAVKQAIWNAL